MMAFAAPYNALCGCSVGLSSAYWLIPITPSHAEIVVRLEWSLRASKDNAFDSSWLGKEHATFKWKIILALAGTLKKGVIP